MFTGKPPILPTLFLVTILLLLTACFHEETEETKNERWPGAWQSGNNDEITRILAKNNVILCRSYKYKVPAKSSEAHLVRCTPDFREWSTYLVWTQLNRVLGPYETDPTMD